jgi:sodium/proline symporter
LLQSRVVTASLAVIALALAYVVEAELIFSLVSYVWAGIGGTFSVVILLTLLWPRFHGRAVVLTIVSGLIFTILWISTGMEQYVTARLLTFFVALLVAVLATYIIPKKELLNQA